MKSNGLNVRATISPALRRVAQRWSIAAQEFSIREFVNHTLDSACDAGIGGRKETVEGHEQQRGVHLISAVLARKGSDLFVVAVF